MDSLLLTLLFIGFNKIEFSSNLNMPNYNFYNWEEDLLKDGNFFYEMMKLQVHRIRKSHKL